MSAKWRGHAHTDINWGIKECGEEETPVSVVERSDWRNRGTASVQTFRKDERAENEADEE